MQENIANFGGDPDLVTVFGESAGAGSIAALTVGKSTDGLFKRAILEVSLAESFVYLGGQFFQILYF